MYEQEQEQYMLLKAEFKPKRLYIYESAGPTRLLPGLAGADFIYQRIGMMK
jgi:hypothetical protein